MYVRRISIPFNEPDPETEQYFYPEDSVWYFYYLRKEEEEQTPKSRRKKASRTSSSKRPRKGVRKQVLQRTRKKATYRGNTFKYIEIDGEKV